MTLDAATWQMLGKGFIETLYMVFGSTLIGYLIGLPLGVLLVVTRKGGIHPISWVNAVVGVITNIFRSIPFIILLIMVMPVTRAIVGTTLGAKAVIPPLVIAAAPYIARVVEGELSEVDNGVIEAAKSMGASDWQIIWKVLLPEAKPSLLLGAALVLTTVVGYSCMSGFVGGGGLGDIAIRYGYYRYDVTIMMITVVILIIIVQLIQEAGSRLSKKSDRRIR
ncbi:MAG: ABC transporter permease [Eubacteriales bacterium]|jgi:D-methionine transport system permease protein|nr:ABC transporter permease [Lachnospiraceae bacterium]MDD5859031.1 ABC transporter permease [Eubacteriales bacterium]MCH4064897.1 ABC transporter permease [Lachnospiraceae bacterium]MCH4103873.1 ABC transporter permease [Lachnospiraceae bacterium]MCI1310300.1 ABC transporter permease [Lachnospiraceae bacterium]